MWVGNVFSRVCLSVRMPVEVMIFELLHIEFSFLLYKYIFTISGSSLSINVIRSRSYEKNYNCTYFNMLKLCIR